MFIRFGIHAAVVVGAILGPLGLRAQDAVTGGPIVVLANQHATGALSAGNSYTAFISGNQRGDRQPQARFSGEFQGGASFQFFVFDHVRTTTAPDGLGAIEAFPAMFGPSYDPFKACDGANGFSAAIRGLMPRPDDLLREGSRVPDAVWVGLAPDTDQTERGNNFEASMTAHFVFRGKARYPLTITFPAYVSLQDEEYFLGPQFGYICAGINVRAPLSFVPSRYGRWSAGTSADFCYYGTTTTEFVRSIGLQIPKLALALNVDF